MHFFLFCFSLASSIAFASAPQEEGDFYPIYDLPAPRGVVLEVAGLLVLEDGRPLISTRRGEMYLVENAYGDQPVYKRFAQGLQEPLGLLLHDGWIYTAQRAELTRLKDTDGDDRADVFETVCDAWTISGNYHEYAFGPRMDSQGNFWIALNKPFGEEPFGRVPWRGWAMRISPDGKMDPVATGLRSPAGIQNSPLGEMFFTDNQGEWCGASKLSHLQPGDFHGHPWGLPSCDLPESLVPNPGHPPNGKLMPEVAREMPTFKLPAVWFPYDKMGKSPAGFLWDQTEGGFGPFQGQVFVGDQHHASIMRVYLEKVNGHWQGACFPFRYGFQSGVLRLAWGKENTLFVGMTNRGWGSRGGSEQGFQRTRWSGKTPFEILKMEAQPDGFRIRFTQPLNPETALDMTSYAGESYTYKLHSDYGSPEVDKAGLKFLTAKVSADGLTLDLQISNLRPGYVHEIHFEGLRSAENKPLLHSESYYTLIHIPTATTQ